MDTSNRSSIILIEDNPGEVAQIKDLLSEDFQVTDFQTFPKDVQPLLKLLSINPNTQIMIIDIVLKKEKRDGIAIIDEELWPLDRHAFFILFSKYAKERCKIELNKIYANRVYVQKEYEGKKLSRGCLNNLKTVVNNCREYCIPKIDPITFAHKEYYDLLYAYPKEYVPEIVEKTVKGSMDYFVESITNSINILAKLAQSTITLTKVGEAALKIGIGVYGSCGRLEMRRDSDVEFTVFFDDPKVEPVARSYWYRIKSLIHAAGLKIEGEEKEPIPNASVERDNIPNEYVPVIYTPRLLVNETKLKKDSPLRDRHFQILTELQAIFNYAYIFEMKKRILTAQFGAHLSLADIVGSTYLGDLISQELLDTSLKDNSISDPQENKKITKDFVYRIFNLLTFKLSLVEFSLNETGDLSTDDGLRLFFDRISEPAIVKLVRLLQYLSKVNSSKQKSLANTINTIVALIREYAVLMESFLPVGPRPLTTTELERIKGIRNMFDKVFKLLQHGDLGLPEHLAKFLNIGVLDN